MAHPSDPLNQYELVIVIIGASAVGKSATAEGLYEAGIIQPTPTWATRQPRPGEKDTCYDHRFVSDEEFDEYSRQGGFIDVRAFYGARYGVPRLEKPPAGKEALMVLKPIFIPKFVEYYPNACICQIEASEESLEDRMVARGQSRDDIAERMRAHPQETADAQGYAPFIFNNDGPLEDTVERVGKHIRNIRKAYNARQTTKP